MESYFFIFDAFAYVNTFLLVIFSILSIIVFNKSEKVLKVVVVYLLFSCFFDFLSRFIEFLFTKSLVSDSAFISIKIIYRLAELLIIGYLINNYWLRSKIGWILISLSSVYLLYDLFTFQAKGILNYEARGQTMATILLVGLVVANLLKQLKVGREFSVTNQMLSMVFLAYFSIHLVYTVIQNFIINQSFTDKSFALFYSSYAVLHIVYYAALAFILFKNFKKQN